FSTMSSLAAITLPLNVAFIARSFRCVWCATILQSSSSCAMDKLAHPHSARPESLAMADSPPDRLSTNPDSPYYDADVLARDVGVRFKGVEKTNVEEYCVSEGWIRVAAGNARDRYGNPLTIKLTGPVEPYFRPKKDAPGG